MSQNTHLSTKTIVSDRNFKAAFTVDQSPEAVYAAINNVREWWSDSIEGRTDKVGEEYKYHFRDIHQCTMRITELVPGKRVVWHVVKNRFSFIDDQREWVDTDVVFEISQKDGKTELRFTHAGLVPDYECFDICRDAWTSYITGSLKNLITTGKGRPNRGEALTVDELKLTGESFTTAFTVAESPEDVYAAINDVDAWWVGDPELEGNSDKLGDEFIFRYRDVHYSKQKVTELVPGKKVAWRVIDARLDFTKDTGEWIGTEIVFDIAKKDGKTEVRFTHIGLVPKCECFEDCSGGWNFYVTNSLHSLITTGKGRFPAF